MCLIASVTKIKVLFSIILVKAKGVICHVTPFNSQNRLQWSPFASNHKLLCDM